MKAQGLLRAQYKQAHDTLEAVMSDVSSATANYVGDGSNVGSIGAIYAHTIFDEDQMISGPTGGTAVYESGGFKDRAELAMPGPMQSQEWSQGHRDRCRRLPRVRPGRLPGHRRLPRQRLR